MEITEEENEIKPIRDGTIKFNGDEILVVPSVSVQITVPWLSRDGLHEPPSWKASM